MWQFLVVMLIFGVVTSSIASNKGRSGFFWFVLGFMTGPLALILAILV